MQISRAAVFYNEHKTQNQPLAASVRDFLRAQHIQAEVITDLAQLSGVELLISVGGDGTMLRCARACAPLNIPLFGINGGTLGFLAASEKEETKKNLQRFLTGQCPIYERFMLAVQIHQPGKTDEKHLAFNDCVLRAETPRAYTLHARFDEQEIPPYFGDGIIVSTPTGSTAYSLAAGGPIVEPGVDVLILTPICPHTLAQRPLILPATGTLILTPDFKTNTDKTALSIDGQINRSLPPGSHVKLTRSPHKVRLVGTPERGFFTLLSRKLNWGGR